MCHMIRPWERPNNLDYLKSIGAVTGHPSKLCEGCDVDDYTMIPFTVFCGSCGVCEYVELMPRFESPVIAFRVFAHRAWREDDHRVIKQFEKYGLWDDCM
jgi:hypothetical protein